jgi:hypothetical protein
MSIEFTNLNQCFSVTQAFGSTGATQLSSFPCTEVFIDNISGQDAKLFSQDGYNTILYSPSLSSSTLSAAGLYYYLKSGESTTIRGITNSAQISAALTSSSGNLTYRTQFFSFNPLNTY